jgi:propionyl-CoA carboxylase alpha chain
MVTGVDLVELMIRIAAGEKLPLSQQDVRQNGWALEARVYAEDPFRGFLPSTGRLVRYRPPVQTPHVRVDTGVEEGGEVSMYYDPMIAKLVTHGATRAEAIARMQDALDAYFIRGVSHNIAFLNAVISRRRFQEGRLSTAFIAEEYPDGFHPRDVPRDDPELLMALSAVVHRRYMDRAARLSGQLQSHERRVGPDFVVIVGREHHPVHVTPVEGGFDVRLGANTYHVLTAWHMGQPLLKAEVNGHRVCVQVDRVGLRYRLAHRGSQIDALVVTPATAAMERLMIEKQQPDLSRYLLSPMPGLLKRISVKVGDEVKAGEELAVVEAMKMENSLRAGDDVKIAGILATEGQSLAVDQPILAFE